MSDGLDHYTSIDELEHNGSQTPAFVPQQRHSMFLVVAALSVLEMVASSAVCAVAAQCHGAPAWGVALGFVSAVICAAYLVTAHSHPSVAEAVLEPTVLFLFWWWVAGVSTVTFYGPFVEVGNGYCATWAALVVVTVLLYGSSSAFRGTLDEAWAKSQLSTHLELLAVASVVELVAACAACARTECKGGAGWAIAVGAVSLGTCAWAWLSSSGLAPALRFSPSSFSSSSSPVPFALSVRSPTFAMAMTGWWMLAVCTLTLSSPFAYAGNGFFGTWAALYASAMLLFAAYEMEAPSLPMPASSASSRGAPPSASAGHAQQHAERRAPSTAAGPSAGSAGPQRPSCGGAAGLNSSHCGGACAAFAPPGCPPGFPSSALAHAATPMPAASAPPPPAPPQYEQRAEPQTSWSEGGGGGAATQRQAGPPPGGSPQVAAATVARAAQPAPSKSKGGGASEAEQSALLHAQAEEEDDADTSAL